MPPSSMRTRPIDVNKALLLADTSASNEGLNDQPEVEITGLQNLGTERSGAIRAPIQQQQTQHQLDVTVGAKGRLEIPVPPVTSIPSFYHRMRYPPYRISETYLKSHLYSAAGIPPSLQVYDLVREDLEFLKQSNEEVQHMQSDPRQVAALTLTEDELAEAMDNLEKEAGKLTSRNNDGLTMDEREVPEHVFPLWVAQQTVFSRLVAKSTAQNNQTTPIEKYTPIYHYWLGRRRTLGKALLPYFVEPPPRGNTSPHVAFRPRVESRRQSKRNPKREDYVTPYTKLQALRRDLERVTRLLESVQQREIYKRDLILTQAHMLDVRLADTPLYQQIADALHASEQPATSNKRNQQVTKLDDSIRRMIPLLSTQLPAPALTSQTVTAHKVTKKAKGKNKAISNKLNKSLDPMPPPKARATKFGTPVATPITAAAAAQTAAISQQQSAEARRQEQLRQELLVLSDEDDSDAEDDLLYYNQLEDIMTKRIRRDDDAAKAGRTISAPSDTEEETDRSPSPSHTSTAIPLLSPSFSPAETAQQHDTNYPPPDVRGRVRARIGRGGRLLIDLVDYEKQLERYAASSKEFPNVDVHSIPYDYHIDTLVDSLDAFHFGPLLNHLQPTGCLRFDERSLHLPSTLTVSDLKTLPADLPDPSTLTDVPTDVANVDWKAFTDEQRKRLVDDKREKERIQKEQAAAEQRKQEEAAVANKPTDTQPQQESNHKDTEERKEAAAGTANTPMIVT